MAGGKPPDYVALHLEAVPRRKSFGAWRKQSHRQRQERLPSWTAACALNRRLSTISVVAAIMTVVMVPVVIVSTVVVSRTVMPGAGDPDPAVRAIRPITGRPDVIHTRVGRNRLHHGHGCGCVNHRTGNDDRQWQPDGDAEADSGIGRHGRHAEQRGKDEYFRFHMFLLF